MWLSASLRVRSADLKEGANWLATGLSGAGEGDARIPPDALALTGMVER